MFSQPQVSVERLFAAEAFRAFARLAHVECARCQRIRNAHVKGQGALQFDLPVEQVNRLRSRQAEVRKNFLNLVFEAGFNAGADGGGFTHAVNVSLL